MHRPAPFARIWTAGLSLAVVLGAALSATPRSAHAGPPAGEYGTIKGRLVWGGSSVPEPEKLKADKDPAVCAKKPLFSRELAIDPKTKGVAFSFAYLVNPKGKNPEAEKALLEAHPKVEIDQEGCEFEPYATAMLNKQQIVFKSSDAIGHNARYSGFTNGQKNIALPPNGSIEAKLVAEKRPLTLNCDIHPWMKGWIMVFDHPFFATTAEDGTFTIEGVPPGTQNLILWQEKVGYVTAGGTKGMPVTVKAGEVTDVGDIVLDPAKVKK